MEKSDVPAKSWWGGIYSGQEGTPDSEDPGVVAESKAGCCWERLPNTVGWSHRPPARLLHCANICLALYSLLQSPFMILVLSIGGEYLHF